MKRKLVAALALMALGAYAPDLRQHAVAWWTATPHVEAQQLHDSLEAAQGWESTAKYIMTTDPQVGRGKVAVYPGLLLADVWSDHANISDCYSLAERRAINHAAKTCLRKLAAQEMERETVEEGKPCANKKGSCEYRGRY